MDAGDVTIWDVSSKELVAESEDAWVFDVRVDEGAVFGSAVDPVVEYTKTLCAVGESEVMMVVVAGI